MDIIATRHTLHAMAEPSGSEVRTSEFIVSQLKNFAPSRILKTEKGHHFLAEYDFGAGATVLFRADMDAVMVQESDKIAYHSENEGVSHKCGHDGHSTIMLRFAELLHNNPLTSGKVLLLFQGAEETGKGAEEIIQDGLLDRYDIKAAFALHNIPGERLGSVVCRTGSFTCSVVSCEIVLTGKTSHAAEPWKAVSPYNTALQLTDKVLALNCRDIDSDNFCVATLIEFRIGSKAYGVTAGDGVLRFTIRTKTESLLQNIMSQIENWTREAVTKVDGLESKINWIEHFASAHNTENEVLTVKKCADELNLEYREKKSPFFWGEDFGLFTKKFPGALFGLGSGERQPPLHHPDFDFPDAIVEDGAAMFYKLAENILEQ